MRPFACPNDMAYRPRTRSRSIFIFCWNRSELCFGPRFDRKIHHTGIGSRPEVTALSLGYVEIIRNQCTDISLFEKFEPAPPPPPLDTRNELRSKHRKSIGKYIFWSVYKHSRVSIGPWNEFVVCQRPRCILYTRRVDQETPFLMSNGIRKW